MNLDLKLLKSPNPLESITNTHDNEPIFPSTSSCFSPPFTRDNLNIGRDVENQEIVYSWRSKLKNKKNFILEAPIKSDSILDLTIHDYATKPRNSDSPNYLELPIALRKPTQSCTLHPISKYVSYNTLSPKFHALTTTLDKTEIPKNINEALKIPE